MNEKRLIIDAVITTVGPLSIKLPSSQDAKSTKNHGFPMQSRGLDRDFQARQTAYLPATTVRGFLRRSATLKRMKQAVANGTPYKMKAIYKELIGQDAISEEKNSSGKVDILALAKEREENPVIDLFGCGLWMKSRLMVGHFMPDEDVQPEIFATARKDIDATEEVIGWMDPEDREIFNERKSSNSEKSDAVASLKQMQRELKKAKKEPKLCEDLMKAITQKKAEIENLGKDMQGMTNSSPRPLFYYALRAGVDLRSRMVVLKARHRDLEILLDGLNDLSLTPVLGGNVARGCGEISGKFHIKDETGRLLKVVSIGGYKPAVVQNMDD